MDKFRHIDTWVFDLDNTLYDSNTGVFDRIGTQMTKYVSQLLKLPLDQAEQVRKGYWQKYGTTLYGLMQEHKVDPYRFLEHAHNIDVSDIAPCPVTQEYLPYLSGTKIVFTNSSRDFAKRMTRQLGIDHHFDYFFSIEDAEFIPKPRIEPYRKVLGKYEINPERAVMFEDMEINLKTAHDLGMTTVWVHGDNKDAETHALPHLHHKTETLADWLLATAKPPGEAGKQTVPQHPTKRK
jgi:putative hydrolase of the HAD superfamily